MMAIEENNDAKAALVALGVAYVSFAVQRPGLFRLMYGGRPPATTVPVGEPPHAAYAALARQIDRLAEPKERGAAFLACWSLVHGLATLLVTERIREPRPDPVAAAEAVGKLFVRAFD